ncbi:hypothetical protein [Actinoplanes sp. NPDC051494]|uniref:hypothetical protein n=1 Tax=Actinoplanes sp. NPDC051494 TaxID=3363907 RepID=UPI00379E9467
MSVIELGLVTDEDPGPPVRPWRPRLSRLGVATVVVLCALTVTGSAPVRSHAPLPLWSIGLEGGAPGDVMGSGFIISRDAVHVLTNPREGRRLSSYDARTGALRWSHPMTRPVDLSTVESGVIVLPATYEPVTIELSDHSVATRMISRSTVGVDAGTGRQLWAVPGELSFVHDGLALVAVWDDKGESVRSVRVMDLRDGTTAWTHPAAGLHDWYYADGSPTGRLVSATTAGNVEVRDFTTGAMITSRRLPGVRRMGADIGRPDLTVIGGTLLTRTSVGERATLTAWDTETLRERWHVDGPQVYGFYDCAPVVCVNEETLSGRDLATGERLWQRAGNGWANTLATGVLATEDGTEDTRRTIVDARSGRVLTDLGTGTTAWSDEPADVAYALIPTREPAGRTAVSRLDGRTGAVTRLGVVDPVREYGCRAAGTLLACATTAGRLMVLDLAPE